MMFLTKCHNTKRALSLRLLAPIFLFTMVFAVSAINASAATVRQKGFSTPDDAVQALVKALESKNRKEVSAIFGPDAKDLTSSGDPIEDKANAERFLQAFKEAYTIRMRSPEVAILSIGNQDFPFPIPLVKDGNAWVFDTKAGMEEIINRRIGRNELGVMDVLRAYVDAQREYYEMKLGADGAREYARKIMSAKGKKDGLYWEVKEGEKESPFGPLVASASEEGYTAGKKKGMVPYNGYYYRPLAGQGSHAAGGAKQYIVNGRMTEGFALVARPAKYGSSGIMTFIVNQDGTVYEKDLGKHTDRIVKGMKLFDPDGAWKPVREALEK
jgi:hypothetical protein